MKPPSFGSAFGVMVKNRRAELRMTQPQLAIAVWPASASDDGESRKGDISKLETGKVPNPQESTVLAICRALELDMAKVNALRVAPPPDPHDIASFMAQIEERSLSDLVDIARRHGAESPEDRSRQWLLSYLREKADLAASLAKRVKELEGISAGIDNIRAEASSAILNGRYDDARKLIDGAVEVCQAELRRAVEANATLTELLADIDLLEGKADHAFTLFSAAADSFAGIGPVEVAKRRRRYAERLMNHGIRYGGQGLPLSIRLFDRLLADLSREASP